jgi:hypothetical protein
MGVSTAPHREDRWAADPEALLLFTFEVARFDARLFDEVLDWLALNERVISAQRLRNLSRDDTDRTLADAALAWASQARKMRRGIRSEAASAKESTRPLFRDFRSDPDRAEAAFAAHGWLKPPTTRSGKSQPPDLFAPINFAFRLRGILGIGARAEVARFLLSVIAPSVTTQVVAEAAGYAKRNVHEALTSFSAAGVIGVTTVGNEQRYDISRDDWAALLRVAVADLPTERAWPQLLYALRTLLRWLEDEPLDGLSPYMRASEARALAEQILPEFRYAGVRVPPSRRRGADYWQDFVELVSAALTALG